MLKRRYIAFCAAAALLAGCAGKPPERPPPKPAPEMFKAAQDRLSSEDWRGAVSRLQSLEATYPFGDYAVQAELDLIFANYMKGDADSTVDEADRFVREHPQSQYVPYALYMKGLANFPQGLNPLWSLFGVDPAEREPDKVEDSFHAFHDLVLKYPKSQYAPDARQRMVFLRNRLGRYELYVAQFYMKRDAWLSAVRRAEYLIQHYPQTPYVPSALQIMVKGYKKLGLEKYADDAQKILDENKGAYKNSG